MSQLQGRVMGIDYGLARIGIAVSDPLRITARGVETVNWNGRDIEWAVNRICELAEEYEVREIVMGLPRRTDGKASPSEDGARAFAAILEERLSLKPIFRDERYTTVLASRVLNEVDYKKQNKRKVIDQVAAEIILQDYINNSL